MMQKKQSERNRKTQKFPVSFPVDEGREERLAYVYLPTSYDENEKNRYPVLYLFDGHNVFFDEDATYGKSWGMEEFLEQNQVQMIVVAVECSHDPDHGRLREYAPFSFRQADVGEIIGAGSRTMDWYAYELKPAVDAYFRTLPGREYTFLAGSSMGGLMTLYGLMQYNHVFSRGAALSPSLWVSPRKVKEMINRSTLHPDTVLYMDYGSAELNYRKGVRRLYGDTTSLLIQKGVMLDSRIVPHGEHCEASWERQIPFFMKTLQYEFK